MRWSTVLVVISVVLGGVPALASAKPTAKLAVAPLDGDTGDRAGEVIVDEASAHAKKVVGVARTRAAIAELGALDVKQLRQRLEVDIVVRGAIVKDGSKKTLELELAGRKASKKLALAASSPIALRSELAEQLGPAIDELTGRDDGSDAGDDDDDARPTAKSEGEITAVVEPPAATPPAPELQTRSSLALDVGLAVARRTLTWSVAHGQPSPPWVGSAAAGLALGGEVYPAALSGVGAYATYTKYFGVSIAVPGTTTQASIDSGWFELGVRYRMLLGDDRSLAFGAGYWARYYVADRSGLAMPSTLDMPDVGYQALAPNAIYRFQIAAGFAGWAQLDIPLVLSSGDIGSSTSYGKGLSYSFDAHAGVQYLLGEHIAIDIVGGFNLVGIAFTGDAGSEAQLRSVTAASDKAYGITAAFGVLY